MSVRDDAGGEAEECLVDVVASSDLPWPPFPEQADRFLSKLVGLAPLAGEGRHAMK
jgi:hypothetical protein